MKLLNRTMLVLLFAFVTMGWTAHESLAAEKEPLPPAAIPINDFGNELEIIENDITPFSTNYIKSGNSLIELLPNSTLRVNGSTNAYVSVNTIRVTLQLQQWSPSKNQWVDALAISPAVNYDSNSISYSSQIKVTSGYSYRVKAQHSVSHNGIIEQLTSVSNQIYVD